MAHLSGNPTWQDYPNLTTPISAAALEKIENRLDVALVKDAFGRIQVSDPAAAQDAATKNYVDSHRTAVVLFPTGNATSDTAAVNTALASGADVILASLTGTAFATSATLVFSSTAVGQRLATVGTVIEPNFTGDCVHVMTAEQEAHVRIQAGSQPAGTTAYQEVAAIRIGSADGVNNAKNASVARSAVLGAWLGNGIILDQGAHVDMTGFSVTTSVTYDGIRGTNFADDSNEALVVSTRISNPGRYGYWLQDNATTPTCSSRSWVFSNAKSFHAGSRNFLIETSQNYGSIFSELGTNPDQFTSTSYANKIDYTATVTMLASVDDQGLGNEISGQNSDTFWDTIAKRVRSLFVHFPGRSGTRHLWQSANYAFNDTLEGSSLAMTVTYEHATDNTKRTDTFQGPVVMNNGLTVNNATLGAALGLSVSGMFRLNTSNRTANTSIPSNGSSFNFCDATSGNITMTLPTSSVSNGTFFTFVKTDASANTVTIAGTINGVTNYVLSTRYQAVKVVYTGSAWIIAP